MESICETYEPKVQTIEEICSEGGLCPNNDIGPATISVTPACDPSAEPIIIDCNAQLDGVTVTITRDYSERKTQCSKSPAGYVPAGKSVMVEVSLAEGSYPPELTAILFETEAEIDEDGYEIIGIDDDAGQCQTPYNVVICPAGGNYELVLPFATIYYESTELQYDVENQRSLTFGWYANSFPGTNRKAYFRRKPAA
jgi:hypothetical protein